MIKKYNHKNCQSLFGYAAATHKRCKWQCQLCGAGGLSAGSKFWRQLTVEHLIGRSDGGYRKDKNAPIDINRLVDANFQAYTEGEKNDLVKKIDELNTVTACQLYNSTTSRFKAEEKHTMANLFKESGNCRELLIKKIGEACSDILRQKKEKVRWKLVSVEDAFKKYIIP